MAIPSAAGTASHTPVTPKKLDNASSNTVIRPKVRRNDKIADSFPFDNAFHSFSSKFAGFSFKTYLSCNG